VGSSVGFTGVTPDLWASTHLGVDLHRVSVVIAEGDDRDAVAGALLHEAAAATEADLLCLQVHAEDCTTLDAAQAAGFRVAGLELSYTCDAASAMPLDRRAAPGVDVTVVRSDEDAGVAPADRDRLLDAAGAFGLSHLGADPRLDPAAVAAFYRAWTANAIDGRWGDRLAVARVGSEAVGVYSWVLDKELQRATGIEVFDRSWAVVSTPGLGIMGAMVHATMGGGCDIRITVCETQASNGAVQRALHRLGAIRAIEAVYVLHRWT
jgi:hypothetical protein